MFNRGVIKMAELMSTWADVFFYQFSYLGNMSPFPAIHIDGAERVSHVGDMGYWWHSTETRFNNTDLSKFSKDDIKTHERTVKMFSNFIKHQNPSISEEGTEFNWPTVNSKGEEHFTYMNINVTLDIEDHPKDDTYAKWVALYDKYSHRPYDTY